MDVDFVARDGHPRLSHTGMPRFYGLAITALEMERRHENADFKFGTATLHLHKSPSRRDVRGTL